MLNLNVFRKHGSLLLAGAAAVTTGFLLYQEYQRRTSAATEQTPDDDQGDVVEEQDYDDDDDDPTRKFKDVMDSLSITRLSQVALNLRIAQTQKNTSKAMSQAEMLSLTCLVYAPLCGSFNLAHKVVFNDGMEWYVRIPGHGLRFGDLDVQKMDSEYHTMRYIRGNTDIPLPEVIFWSSSTDLIGVPFGVISAVQGESLCLEWDDMPEDKRCTVLNDVARYMSQLQALSYSQIGALQFSEDGTYSEIGARVSLQGPCAMEVLYGDLDFFNSTKTVARGPYSSSLDALVSRIEAADKETDHVRRRANLPILRAAVETMPIELLAETRFCLHMPDFDWQNIFVSPDGRVTGFIDWDGVSTEASISGYAQVPLWLCADWNPVYYKYDADAIDSCGNCGDMSPEDHRKYREIYSQAVATRLKDVPGYDPRMSSLSHVVTAIDLAADDDFGRQYVVAKLLKEANVPFKLFDYCNDFESGDASAKDIILREAFLKAWKEGWDTAKVARKEGPLLHAEQEDVKEGSIGSSSFEVLEVEEESVHD